jgi:hypothetical protein
MKKSIAHLRTMSIPPSSPLPVIISGSQEGARDAYALLGELNAQIDEHLPLFLHDETPLIVKKIRKRLERINEKVRVDDDVRSDDGGGDNSMVSDSIDILIRS